uniref:E3 ubiquitin/ISG15 ligase TRIM25-like n=2 Tax=Scleropages formosus TaxID=113540 RepID=A0A8C9R760_SCLFO
MAQVGELLDKNQFSCSFCLDLLKDPVTIPCGHNYCMDCIKRFWDGAGRHHHVRVYSCPQCRQTFTPRPVLGRNTMLAEMLMKIGKIGFLTTPPDQSYAGPGDVECDVCTGRKRKAVKSCLVCLVSHCDTHLKFHDELNPGKRHKLIDATGQLKNKVCSHHDKLLEVYCRTDQQCICYQCMMAEHKGHDTVCAITERTEQQTWLAVKQRECQKRIEQREKEVQELRQTAD